jgi:hypothetical protein
LRSRAPQREDSSPERKPRKKSLTRVKINNNAEKEDINNVKLNKIRSNSTNIPAIVIHINKKEVRSKKLSSEEQEEIKEELSLAVVQPPKSTFEVIGYYLGMLRGFIVDVHKTSNGIDIYPYVKEGSVLAMQSYHNFMEATSNPIINNIAKGFATTFIPKFRMLLININRLGGGEVLATFMRDIGFVEIIMLNQAQKTAKEIAKMFIQISSPLGWAYTIANLAKMGIDITKFIQEGGLIGKLGLIKDKEVYFKRVSEKFVDGTLRKTMTSAIDDLTSHLVDTDMRDISSYCLKILLLGKGKSSIKSIKGEINYKPISPFKSIAAPFNDQIGTMMSSSIEGFVDYFIRDINIDNLFDENSLIIKENDSPIEEEDFYREILFYLGSIVGDQIVLLLANYASTLPKINKTPELLLTEEVKFSILQNAIKNASALVAQAGISAIKRVNN